MEQPYLAPSFVSELGLRPAWAARPTAALMAHGGHSDITLVEEQNTRRTGSNPEPRSVAADCGRSLEGSVPLSSL